MAATTAWMPTQGRHQVHIGPSLVRSIKARKMKSSPGTPNGNGSGPTKRSNIPDKEFYAFRYAFKPGSIDSTKPASLEIKKNAENTQVLAEFPSKELNEVCMYNGLETPAKEVDCLLIYDEETGQYTLEKLDSVVTLKHEGKRTVVPAAPSPVIEPSTSSTSATNSKFAASNSTPNTYTKAKHKHDDLDDDLEELLLADINGINNTTPTHSSQTRDINKPKTSLPTKYRQEEEEEEEEGEEVEIPLSVLVPSKRPPPASSSTSRPTKSLPKKRRSTPPPLPQSQPSAGPSKPPSRVSSNTNPAVPPAPKPKPPPKETKNKTIPTALDEAAEPGRPIKKARLSTSTAPSNITSTNTSTSRPATLPTQAQKIRVDPPNPKPPIALSLPGKESTFIPPPAPAGPSIPKKGVTTSAPPPPLPLPITVPPGVSANITMEEILGDEDEEEEDWEQVPTVPAPISASKEVDYDAQLENEIFGSFGQEDGEEIDEKAFERELDEEMFGIDEGDEDEDIDEAIADLTAPTSNSQPISLNQFAKMGAEGESDDEFSSSDSDSD